VDKMSGKVKQFKWIFNTNEFEWEYKGVKMTMTYILPIQSVIELNDHSGFAIVVSKDELGTENAKIINSDGTDRIKLKIPDKVEDVICFHEIYYVNGDITAIIATRSRDIACVFDLTTGTYTKIYETR
jgi:hypothetical protein